MIGQEAGTGISDLLTYGPLGLVLVLILLGFLEPKGSVDRLAKDKARAEEQRDEMTRFIQEQVIPTLQRSNELTAKVAEVMSRRPRA